MRVFIDTNLWVYRLDHREPAKSERIRHWLASVIHDHEVVISTQVLIELVAVARRKLEPPLSDGQISELLEALAGFEVVSTDANLVMDAHLLASRETLSWGASGGRLTPIPARRAREAEAPAASSPAMHPGLRLTTTAARCPR